MLVRSSKGGFDGYIKTSDKFFLWSDDQVSNLDPAVFEWQWAAFTICSSPSPKHGIEHAVVGLDVIQRNFVDVGYLALI